ncbi:MAG: ATP-dependent DNA helicase, partial [Alphaproteobacteria bacterium]|nr:ATP-dependent DNA helicase [Alphaproteobacteria bacterium]
MEKIKLPLATSVVTSAKHAALLDSSGEIAVLSLREASQRLAQNAAVIGCHAPTLRERLDRNDLLILDLLELYVFVLPCRPCVPSILGLVEALGLPPVKGSDQSGLAISQILVAETLLERLRAEAEPEAVFLAGSLTKAGWGWGAAVQSALAGVAPVQKTAGFQVWKGLAEYYSEAPPPPATQRPVSEAAARLSLSQVLGEDAEKRVSQADYAAALTWAFAPRAEVDSPNLVLAEAGTGVGKTIGYLVPSFLWARQNQDRVWVSTYSRNLQNQIMRELEKLYPDATERGKKCVIRRGRENYLCLLNYEEALRLSTLNPSGTIALGLMARWLAKTNDGDLRGADFPQFLPLLVGREWSTDLADRRGECIYGACSHYNKCFIEKSIRKAQQAEIVIANHALVLFNLSCFDPAAAPREPHDGPEAGGGEGVSGSPSTPPDSLEHSLPAVAADPTGSSYLVLPQRLVFDEGQHIFAAADAIFAVEFSTRTSGELRQWLLGKDDSQSRAVAGRRSHGLALRVEPLLHPEDQASRDLLQIILKAARELPRGLMTEERGRGAIEELFALVRHQTLQQAEVRSEEFGLEAAKFPQIDGLVGAARRAEQSLESLAAPLERLRLRLLERLVEEAESIETSLR